jgi:hypothetical protein
MWRLANWIAARSTFDKHFKTRTPSVYLFAWAMSQLRARYDRQQRSSC